MDFTKKIDLKTLSFLFLALTGIFFISCKKYPQDEFVSFRSPRYRLKGLWKIEKMPDNSARPLNTEDEYFEFASSNSLKYSRFYYDNYYIKEECYFGEWKFEAHKNQIKLTWNHPIIIAGSWEIKQLEFDKIKICINNNNQEQCLKLTRRQQLK